jgi:hypothetical protein
VGPALQQVLRAVAVDALGPQVGDGLGGVGQDEDPARVVFDDAYAVGRVGAAGAGPRLAAQGVGTERFSRWASGIRWSIWDSVRRVRATRPSTRVKAAMPSTVGLNSGMMKPPRPSPAKMLSSAVAALVRTSWEVEVQSTWTPWKRQTCSATRVVVTGSATRPPRRSAATRSSTTSRPRSSLISSPFSLTSVMRSPTGSNRTPNAAREDDTSSPRRCRSRMRSARVSVGDTSSSRLLTVSTSTPSRPSSCGSTSEAVPPAQSMTIFSPASRTPRRSTQRSMSRTYAPTTRDG